jgi:glycosyltransferase involved in cell wall biosynthesis
LDKHLHIICFTIPYPVNYGGVVDLFWKLPYLQQSGVKIHLHCYQYNDSQQQEILSKYCYKVYYYKRQSKLLSLASKLPFMVALRSNKELTKVLLNDNHPILLEGIQSSFIATTNKFISRKIYLRLHNVEQDYYKHLQQSTSNLLKKIMFAREVYLLKKYEASLPKKVTQIFAVTKKDAATFAFKTQCTNVVYLPLFIPNNWQINTIESVGSFCLYNGDLSISANQKSVIWLLKNVFSCTTIPLVIAGKNPSKELMKLAEKNKNTCLIANPSNVEMDDLIAKAHINILPSSSSAGIKLKLLNALYNGKHCIANDETLSGSELQNISIVANTANEFITEIERYFHIPFTNFSIEKRQQVLHSMFDNNKNVENLIAIIFEERKC